ncbi:carbonic anhydrase [Planotetraspora thailandica]|uniref:carbonic anhydrase n=1 Tax=Planotetraspora thailandica TaxID=487172 RepID=A0A8J3V5T0_9ACTN|nr:carbonic anhydrase [Planotetraspora thailandica]GII56575.1 carbonic anhydrase [Planotetraspora thailandica]
MANVVSTFVDRNRTFAETRFIPQLRMRPSLATNVITCFDPRVDPAVVLGAEQGEIGVIRNVGGRVTPHTIEQLVMLQYVAAANGSDTSTGWNIVVLHHTQCGITTMQDRPDLLAPYFEVPEAELPGVAVGDPRAAVARDVVALRAEPRLPGFQVSGLVYDVVTGLVETVVTP